MAEDLGEKVTHISVFVCDQGHYGFKSCGNCNHTLEDKKNYDVCPNCHYRFKGVKVSTNLGGSDF